MTLSPSFEEFKHNHDALKPQIVFKRLISDLETPVSAYLKLAAGRSNTFLLESVEGGEKLGRYSIIGAEPDAIWRASGDKAEVHHRGEFEPEGAPPLPSLKTFIDKSRIDMPPGAPPMAAGVFGFFSYDMVRQMERLGPRPKSALDLPDAMFIRPTMVAIFDNIRQEIILATPARPAKGVSARDAYLLASQRIDDAATRLSSPPAKSPMTAISETAAANTEGRSNTPRADYAAMVAKAKEHIAAGDIFQVVLSQRFQSPFDLPPFELYRALRRTNPSPFLFFLDFESFAIAGSSPEILVRVRDGEVTIRPIAGTRPRGSTAQEDARLADELLADPKERAEHLMLLDLGRNDVGRSAEIGSVKVTEQFAIERYSHVMHIVSNVTGRLKAGMHPVDAVVAGFPAGTVTGAPKIRAMEIIDTLERDARGLYGGCIGYFSADGNVDTCIALRTAVIKDGVMHVQAGAGIVADSDASNEQAECENKAKALFAAKGAALAARQA